MTFYTDLAEIALDLITEFGMTVQIERLGGETFNPVSGTNTGGVTASYDAEAALFDYNLKYSGIINETGTMIKAGDKKILVAADGLAITPALNDVIIAGSRRYSIVNIRTMQPSDDVAVYYEIQGRI